MDIDKIFGPLKREHCIFFKIVSIVFLSLFIIFLIGIIVSLKELKLKILIGAFFPLLVYYIYRLFYSICVSSLKPSEKNLVIKTVVI
tara:strand:- start:6148 stop:6408 length:261 start_codon:yes stop_codon:yes gene_type:complete